MHCLLAHSYLRLQAARTANQTSQLINSPRAGRSKTVTFSFYLYTKLHKPMQLSSSNIKKG